ncbi:MAG TPA: cupin domain-containing protein [Acetobacteraceae bacterium]|nr:cupin domain-containing protein [Acetobacteraceae bacterium]
MEPTTFVHVTHPEIFDSPAGRLRILLTAEQTGGAFCLLQCFLPIGFVTPKHVHAREDVAVYLLEGKLECIVGDVVAYVHSGETVLLPRNVPHQVRSIGATEARAMLVCAPAGCEDFLRAIGTPALMTPPSAPEAEHEKRVSMVMERFGLRLLG